MVWCVLVCLAETYWSGDSFNVTKPGLGLPVGVRRDVLIEFMVETCNYTHTCSLHSDMRQKYLSNVHLLFISTPAECKISS